MQRLLVAIAIVVVAHSAIVIGQANICVAPPQIPDILRKFQLTILSYLSTRTKLIIWASVSKPHTGESGKLSQIAVPFERCVFRGFARKLHYVDCAETRKQCNVFACPLLQNSSWGNSAEYYQQKTQERTNSLKYAEIQEPSDVVCKLQFL